VKNRIIGKIPRNFDDTLSVSHRQVPLVPDLYNGQHCWPFFEAAGPVQCVHCRRTFFLQKNNKMLWFFKKYSIKRVLLKIWKIKPDLLLIDRNSELSRDCSVVVNWIFSYYWISKPQMRFTVFHCAYIRKIWLCNVIIIIITNSLSE